MAEVLIQWKSHLGNPRLPKRGDVRHVASNDNTWGLREDRRAWVAAGRPPELFPGDYAVVRVNGISVPNLRKAMRKGRRAAIQGDLEFDAPDAEDRFVRLHRFVWRINISELTPAQRSAINTDRYVEIPAAKFREISEQKIRGVRFDETDPDGEGGIRLPGAG